MQKRVLAYVESKGQHVCSLIMAFPVHYIYNRIIGYYRMYECRVRPGVYLMHVQDDLILYILHMLKGTLCLTWPILTCPRSWSVLLRSINGTFSWYSRLTLSRLCLSRITVYLEVKIWFLFEFENLSTVVKILWKRGDIAPQEQFLLFSTIFSLTSSFRSQMTYSFEMCGCLIYFFLSSANLIYRVTDISKYFRESLGLGDNESKLY